MICNISNSADCNYFLRTVVFDSELQSVMIVDPDGVIAIVKSLKVQRVKHKEVLDTSGCYQRIYTLLVFGNDGFLETVFLVLAFSVIVELLQIVFFVLYNHTSYYFWVQR